MKTGRRALSALLAASVGIASAPAITTDAMISSFAFVQDDGSLKIAGHLVHLYGIHIPRTEQTCYTFTRPVSCGTRASLALGFRISGDFVRCVPIATLPDNSITASCRSGNDDLSEWMLQRGWAVALPDAPFEYVTLERIARAKGVGIWGIAVDAPRR